MTSDILEGGGAGCMSWFREQFNNVTKSSAPQQLAIGCGTGWCAGVVFNKVGKTAAASLAGGLLLFRIAEHQGYIKINWKKVQKDIDKAQDKLNAKETRREFQGIVKEVQVFVANNKYLVTGFGGGFLLGLATF